jgi:hypothetical protein
MFPAEISPASFILLLAAVPVFLVLKHLVHLYRLNDPFYRLQHKEDARIKVGRR